MQDTQRIHPIRKRAWLDAQLTQIESLRHRVDEAKRLLSPDGVVLVAPALPLAGGSLAQHEARLPKVPQSLRNRMEWRKAQYQPTSKAEMTREHKKDMHEEQ